MWCVIDLEVQNHQWYGSVASPHNPENYIVAAAWATDNGAVEHEYFDNKEQSLASDWLARALRGNQILVAHNATFEIQWLMKSYPETFQAFLRNGGRVYCTQYAEFLLSQQQEFYPSLEDTSLKYGGTKKIDEVKLLWESGVLTADIDKGLLLDYLCNGDIPNTRLVCFKQIPLLKERGMYQMMWLRMESLLFNALSTFNGLYVDTEVAYKNLELQQKEIAELQAQIAELLPADLPEEFQFKYTSGYHMSAFLYGGTIRYKTRVPYDPPKFEKADWYKNNSDERFPVADGIPDDVQVYKSGKNKGLPKVFREDTDEPKLKWGEADYTFKGLIDLQSLPKVVSDEFLAKNATFKGKREQVCGTPVYSTGKDALAVLAAHTDIAKPLRRLADLQKDTGTYYLIEQYDDEGNVIKQSGMLQFVEPDGIIHHQLNNCATVTGRLSGSKPNMQNIPRDGTSRVKEMFCSRFGADGRIVEVDFSALEVVTLAAISGDKNLMQQLIDGTDMHCYRLAGKLGEPYDEVFEKCHNKDHPEHKLYKQMRTDIKPQAFANQYGASAAGISFATGCTLEDAEKFQDTEKRLFPESSMFSEKFVRPEVERTGLEEIHREQREDGTYGVYRRGYFTAKSGTQYSFRQFEKRVQGELVMDYKDTQLANYWCQGEASFIVQASCGRVIRMLLQAEFADGKVLPVNTVHDAIYLDCATADLAKEYGTKVQQLMESTPKYLTNLIPALKEWRYDTTPFPAAAEMGVNMMNKTDI